MGIFCWFRQRLHGVYAKNSAGLFSVRASGLSLRSRFSTPNGHFLPSSNGYCHTKFLDKKLQIRHLDNLCVCGNSHTDWRPGYSNDDGSTHDSAVHFGPCHCAPITRSSGDRWVDDKPEILPSLAVNGVV